MPSWGSAGLVARARGAVALPAGLRTAVHAFMAACQRLLRSALLVTAALPLDNTPSCYCPADREADEAKRRALAKHKQLTKQRQHRAMLPGGAAGRRAALVTNKGQRLLANAQRLQADKVRGL